jgi:TRAP-type C4-dicarboxylate transport system permease small subunit
MVRQFSELVEKLTGALLICLLATLVVVVFAAVVARYGFNSSLVWSDEVARGLLVWLVFLGAASAYHRSELVDIGLVRDHLPDRAAYALRVIGTLLVMAFLGFTIFYGIELMQKNVRQVSAVLRIKQNYFSAAVTVGSVVMLIHVIADVYDFVTGAAVRKRTMEEEIAAALT